MIVVVGVVVVVVVVEVVVVVCMSWQSAADREITWSCDLLRVGSNDLRSCEFRASTNHTTTCQLTGAHLTQQYELYVDKYRNQPRKKPCQC